LLASKEVENDDEDEYDWEKERVIGLHGDQLALQRGVAGL